MKPFLTGALLAALLLAIALGLMLLVGCAPKAQAQLPVVSVSNETVTNVLYFNAKATIAELQKHNSLESLINELCASGEVCKVKGHRFENQFNTYAFDDHQEHRKCSICGMAQSRPRESEWK